MMKMSIVSESEEPGKGLCLRRFCCLNAAERYLTRAGHTVIHGTGYAVPHRLLLCKTSWRMPTSAKHFQHCKKKPI